jgi:pimeloyl-ACP methyl ester carboxylesterase
MAEQLARASDRFKVTLRTSFGGIDEESRLDVAIWGRGPAVYMLHGWGGRGGQWVSFVDPLVAAGFAAVTLDAPMHGDSPGSRTSILHFAAALASVVDSVGPARLVVGHSLGAAACSLALRDGLDAPGIALIGSPADPADFFGTFLGRLGIGARLQPLVRADVERRYGFRWDDLKVRPPARPIRTSALVVHDRDDREVDFADAERVTGTWPGAQLLATQGLGHQRILRNQSVVDGVIDFAGAVG